MPPGGGNETVKVIVRCRPMNKREKDMKCENIISMDPQAGQVGITNPGDKKSPPKNFTFDAVYFIDSVTEQIYADVAYPLVDAVAEGFNGTIFAYGQTGCGKSFSMQGIPDPASQRGIIPRSFQHIFETTAVTENAKFLVHSSYIEIYNEEIRDLLGKDVKQKLDLKEHPGKGIYVAGLSMHPVHNVDDCEAVMDKGWGNRSTGATLMNAESSRSHSIFTVYMEMMTQDASGGEHIRAGKLNLVDLAGSERQGKTGATGDRLKEANKINLSLSALGNVISALVDGKSKHIPYRDSKLTRLLQDSLGGNTKTLMVAAISPASDNYDETLSTLRYANRAKNIKNKPKINEDPKDALLRQYQEEIENLKLMLAGQGPGAVAPVADPEEQRRQIEAEVMKEKEKLKMEYEEQMSQLKEKYETKTGEHKSLERKVKELETQYQQKMRQVETKVEYGSGKDMLPLTTQAIAQDDALKRGGPESGGLAPPSVPMRSGSIVATNDDDFIAQTETQLLRLQEQHSLHITDSFIGKVMGVVRDRSKGLAEKMGEYNTLIFKRLQELQEQIVGGEQANNEELKKKRRQKLTHAEKVRAKIAEAISKMDDDGIMLQVYDNMQEDVKAKNELLGRARDKIRALEREITDLQSEFEFDRIDYLDTIRRQEQQLKMYLQILEKVQPCLRRDCNYSNLAQIQKQAVWNEDSQRWVLPELTLQKTNLPPTGGITAGGRQAPGVALPRSPGAGGKGGATSLPTGHYGEGPEHDSYIKLLNSSDAQQRAEEYFQPTRDLRTIYGYDPKRFPGQEMRGSPYAGSPASSYTGLGGGGQVPGVTLGLSSGGGSRGFEPKPSRLDPLQDLTNKSRKKF